MKLVLKRLPLFHVCAIQQRDFAYFIGSLLSAEALYIYIIQIEHIQQQIVMILCRVKLDWNYVFPKMQRRPNLSNDILRHV